MIFMYIFEKSKLLLSYTRINCVQMLKLQEQSGGWGVPLRSARYLLIYVYVSIEYLYLKFVYPILPLPNDFRNLY